MIRTSLFWIHLACGVSTGVIILVMSFTGAALALQPQILAFVERDQRDVSVPAGRARLSVETLMTRVKEQKPEATVTGFILERAPERAATVTFAPAVTAYVDPYTGSLTGVVQQQGARKFFRTMTDWHRWLGQQGPSRDGARWITGISNAAFLGLAVTGLFLWWPRVWTWAVVSSVAIFRPGLK